MTPLVGSAVTYTYNGYGALTGDSTGRSFTWDGLQQLTSMTAGGVTTNFSYDPLGRRTGLTQGSTSKTFFYDELDILSDGTNTYLDGQGLDNPLRMNDGSANSYYLSSQIGSITRLINSSGASTGHYQYLPYGSLLSSSTPVSGNPLTYTGREDDGTGLMYYRARYYDPSLQAFISQDAFGDDQRYVGGNPIIFRDPMGHGPKGAVIGASAGGIIGGGIGAAAGATGGATLCSVTGPGALGCGAAGAAMGAAEGAAIGATGGGSVGSIVEDYGVAVSCGFALATAQAGNEAVKLATPKEKQIEPSYEYQVTFMIGGDPLAQFLYRYLTGQPGLPMVQLPSLYPGLPGNVQYRDVSKSNLSKVDIHQINSLKQKIKYTFR